MNTVEKSAIRWRRFVLANLMLVLCAIVTTGIFAFHVLRAESAKPPVTMLAGGLLWIAILLWGIFSLQMMAFLNTKWRAAYLFESINVLLPRIEIFFELPSRDHVLFNPRLRLGPFALINQNRLPKRVCLPLPDLG